VHRRAHDGHKEVGLPDDKLSIIICHKAVCKHPLERDSYET